jgi:hypothetical protein
VLGSRRWVASLNLPLAAPWRPWTSSTGQVMTVITVLLLMPLYSA